MKTLSIILILCMAISSSASPPIRCSSLEAAQNYVSVGAERPNEVVLNSLPLTINDTRYEMEVREIESSPRHETISGDLVERNLTKPAEARKTKSFKLNWSRIGMAQPNGELVVTNKNKTDKEYKLNCSASLTR